MTFTCIGKENYEGFSKLLGGSGLSGDKLYIGVIEDEMAVGAGVFSAEGDILVIDSLFVMKSYRRRGIGTAILQEITSMAKRSGAKSIWANFVGSEEIKGFLESLGFITYEDCSAYNVPVQLMIMNEETKKLFEKIKEKPEDRQRANTFDNLTSAQLNAIKSKLIKKGVSDVEEMISSLSRQRYSIAVYKNSECKDISAVIIADVKGDYIIIKYIANLSGNPRDFIFLLKQFLEMIEHWRMTFKILFFCTAENEIKQIISKLAGYEVTPVNSMMVAFKSLQEGDAL